jgi:hypothetical protein
MNINLKSLHTAFLSLLMVTSLAQAQDNSPRLLGDGNIGEEEIVKLLDKSLPTWDESVLRAQSYNDPVKEISFSNLAAVLGESVKEEPPQGATQLDDGVQAFRLQTDTGKVRYVNRDRAWDFKRDADSRAVDSKRAVSIARSIAEKLGFSREEMNEPVVRTQMAGGAKAGSLKVTDNFEMYSLVFIQRQINKLPVYQSDIRLAVNNQGEVQRLGIEWPRFELDPAASLRNREDVLKQAAREIALQDPDADLQINATLAYAQQGEEGEYIPVAVIAVNSLPTPYQMLVELTDLAGSPDKE